MTPIKDAEKEAVLRIITGIQCLPKFSNYNVNWGIIDITVRIRFDCPGLPDIFVDVPIDLFLDTPHGERIVCELFDQQFLRNQKSLTIEEPDNDND